MSAAKVHWENCPHCGGWGVRRPPPPPPRAFLIDADTIENMRRGAKDLANPDGGRALAEGVEQLLRCGKIVEASVEGIEFLVSMGELEPKPK